MKDAARSLLRLITATAGMLLAATLAAPGVAGASASNADILATLELPQGDIDFELEVGTLHFFDEEGVPFAIEIIDGCGVNGHLWVFGAGLSAEPAQLTIVDQRGGQDRRLVLPPFEPGAPIDAILDTEALEICDDSVVGGLPPVTGTATYTSAVASCPAATEGIELRSEGEDDSYRTLIRSGSDVNRVISQKPIAVVDEASARDELHLLAEGRTPRLVEGVVFSGRPGMLPPRAELDRVLAELTNGRIRRAFETAKNGRMPQGIAQELGLGDVDCVHHVSLQLDSFGADALLAEAGWIRDGGAPLVFPEPVAERFVVELAQADGEVTRLPLIGPLAGTEADGIYWEYQSEDAKVHIIDACALSGSMWTAAAALTDEPLQLSITDTITGAALTQLLWTDRSETSRLTDTAGLPACA